jgi:hypothetical protein
LFGTVHDDASKFTTSDSSPQKSFQAINIIELQAKTNVSHTLKDHMQHFNDTLNTLTVDDNIFKPTQYHPNQNKIPIDNFKQLKNDFHTKFQPIADYQNIIIDQTTQKFLLFLCSSTKNYADFVLPTITKTA